MLNLTKLTGGRVLLWLVTPKSGFLDLEEYYDKWCGTPHTSRARGLWPATPFRLNSKKY